MSRLTTGQKGILVSGIPLLVAYFLPWKTVGVPCEPPLLCLGSTTQSGLAGIGWAGFLLVIGVLLWETGIISGAAMNTGTVSPALIGAALGGAAAASTLVRFVTTFGGGAFGVGVGPGIGAWIGIGLAALLAGSSWLRYREGRASPAEG